MTRNAFEVIWVKKENALFLVGGLLLGALGAYGLYDFLGRGASGPGVDSGTAAGEPAAGTPTSPGRSAPGATPAAEIANLERVLATDPRNVTALTSLGNLMYDSHRWSEALGYYRRALEAGPQNPNVLTDAGICYRQTGRPDQALDYFRRAQQADPSHWQSLFNEAVVAGFDLGQFDVADAAVVKLAKLNPEAPGLEKLRQDLAQARAAKGKSS